MDRLCRSSLPLPHPHRHSDDSRDHRDATCCAQNNREEVVEGFAVSVAIGPAAVIRDCCSSIRLDVTFIRYPLIRGIEPTARSLGDALPVALSVEHFLLSAQPQALPVLHRGRAQVHRLLVRRRTYAARSISDGAVLRAAAHSDVPGVFARDVGGLIVIVALTVIIRCGSPGPARPTLNDQMSPRECRFAERTESHDITISVIPRSA